MHNEDVVHTHNGILFSIKWNRPESVAVRWKNLQPVIQSEAVRKRKTNIIYQHTYVYIESRKIVLMNIFAEKECRCRHKE